MPLSLLKKALCWSPFPFQGRESIRMRQLGEREEASKGSKTSESRVDCFTWPMGAMPAERRSTSTTPMTSSTSSLRAWQSPPCLPAAPAPRNACRERAAGRMKRNDERKVLVRGASKRGKERRERKKNSAVAKKRARRKRESAASEGVESSTLDFFIFLYAPPRSLGSSSSRLRQQQKSALTLLSLENARRLSIAAAPPPPPPPRSRRYGRR